MYKVGDKAVWRSRLVTVIQFDPADNTYQIRYGGDGSTWVMGNELTLLA